ncbi:hypothetical protein ADUPG1_008102, partial [Aduncisulcus paluster]
MSSSVIIAEKPQFEPRQFFREFSEIPPFSDPKCVQINVSTSSGVGRSCDIPFFKKRISMDIVIPFMKLSLSFHSISQIGLLLLQFEGGKFQPKELLLGYESDGKQFSQKLVTTLITTNFTRQWQAFYVNLKDCKQCTIKWVSNWTGNADFTWCYGIRFISLSVSESLPPFRSTYNLLKESFESSHRETSKPPTIISKSPASTSSSATHLDTSSSSSSACVASSKILNALFMPNSYTLTSPDDIQIHCVLGKGGFGEVFLVSVNGIKEFIVLKRFLKQGDIETIIECKKEFRAQQRMFLNPKCYSRIARPMYILNLLDKSTLRGVYGFMMEFCAGGSVSDFVRDWCFSRPKIDKLPYESEGSEDDFDDLIASSPPQPDPIRIACVCVHMIECLHDVFVSRPEFIDRDIKPDNFLVRVDPISNVCTIVLGDL